MSESVYVSAGVKLQWSKVSNPPQLALHYMLEGCLEGQPAVHILIQCTPLLVEKASKAPDVTLRFTLCKTSKGSWQENHPGFETYGKGHMKSKIGAISAPTKWKSNKKFNKKS